MPRSQPAGVSALAVLPALAILGIGVAASRLPILTPDVWWHLATGRVIAQSGIPRVDPFSYTLGSRPWLVHEWLADRILYTVHALWGLLGVVHWRGVAIAVAVAVSYRLARRHASMGVVLPLWGLAAFALQRNWIDRPQLWTFVLVPLVVLLLEMHRQGARRAAWALPPIFALWVNVHGGFMLGLVLVLSWTAAEAWQRRRLRRPDLVIAGACVVATLLNPHGFAGATYPLHYLGTGLEQTIQEEQPGTLDSPYAWVHFGLVLALAVTIGLRFRAVPFAHRVVAVLLIAVSWPRLGSLALPFAAERHAPLFLLAAVPILCWQVQALLPASVARAGSRITAWGRTGAAWTAIAVVAAFVVWQLGRALPRDGGFAARVLPGRFPAGAADWLAEARLPGPLINPYRWGGFLAWRLWPETKVWIDSRGDLYGRERLAEDELLYRMPQGADAAVEALLERWDANVIVWFLLTADFGDVRVHPFARWLLARPDWRLVYVDTPDRARPDAPAGTTAVFLRVHPRNQAELLRWPTIRLPRLP